MSTLDYSNRCLTLEKLESERCNRGKRTGRYMSSVLRTAHRVHEREEREAQEEAVRMRRQADPRLAGVGSWDRAVLEAIDILGQRATDAQVLTRLRQQGNQSLTPSSLLIALKRLVAHGLIEATSRDERGDSVRVWTSTPEGA